MKFGINDLKQLRWNLLAFCIAVLISAMAFYLSNTYISQRLNEQNAAQNRLVEARHRLQAAQEDQLNMTAYANEYDALKQFGVIGNDRRLDWLEGMEKIRSQHLVPDFSYSISPQKNYVPQPPIETGNFNLHYSETRLRLKLLHAGQLLGFFHSLRSQVSGWYQLDGCSLLRTTNDGDTIEDDAPVYLTAECNGGWVTLEHRGGTS